MYEHVKAVKKANVLCLKISGGLSAKEHEEIGRLLEQQAAKFGRIRLLLIFQHYPEADRAESLYEDLKFAKLAAEKIERMAVVGDGAWQETWVGLFGLFGGVETAYFEHADTDKAAEWLVRGA